MTCTVTWTAKTSDGETWSDVAAGAEVWTAKGTDAEPWYEFFLATEDCVILTTEADELLYLEAA